MNSDRKVKINILKLGKITDVLSGLHRTSTKYPDSAFRGFENSQKQFQDACLPATIRTYNPNEIIPTKSFS